MNQYSPVLFKNPDKRIDLPNITEKEFDKDNLELDLEAIKKIKEMHDV